jgi:Chaperone of endosialidase
MANTFNHNGKVVITDGGNVGIGTTGPISYSGYTTLAINNASEGGVLDLMRNGTSAFRVATDSSGNSLYGNTNLPIVFYTNTNERMRITSAGNVGINSTASSVFVLDVFSKDNAYNTRIYQPSTSTGAYVSLLVSGAMTSAVGYFGAGGSAAGNASFRDSVVIGSQSAHPLVLNTSDAERMRITSAGNVGIGTTSPGYKLDVNGTAMVRDNMYTTGSLGIELTWSGNDINDSRIGRIRPISTPSQNPYAGGLAFDYYKYDGSAYNFFEGMRLNGSGNVGIGTTSPSYKLHVSGNVYINETLFVNQLTTIEDSLIVYDNVGIGTTSPGSKLDVISSSTQIADFRSTVTDGLSNIRVVNDQQTTASGTSPAAIELVGKRGSSTHGRHAWIGAEGVDGTTFRTQIKFKVRPEDSPYQWSTLPTQMVIDGNGNVGVGTTSPTQKLEVNGNIKLSSTAGATATPSFIWLGNDYSNGTTRDKLKIYLYNSGTEQYGFSVGSIGDVQYHSNSTHDFYVNNGNAVRINSSGNVGIGTTSPGEKLEVNGVAKASGFISGNFTASTQGFSIEGGDSSVTTYRFDSDRFRFFSGNFGEIVTIQESGNVGIGNTSPGFKLHIKSSGLGSYPLVVQRAANNNNIFYIYEDGSGNGTLTIENSGGGAAVSLNSNGVSYLNGGNVGIGTTSPLNPLFVSASNAADYAAFIENTNSSNGYGLVARTAHTGTSAYAFAARAAATDIFVVRADGNVGIGTTSPAQKLDVNGAIAVSGTTFVDSTRRNIYLDSFSAGGGAGIFFRDGFTYNASITAEDHNGSAADGICISGSDGISFSTGSNSKNERMRITSAGNVGIGTTSPTGKLEIAGATELLRLQTVYPIGSARGIISWYDTTDVTGRIYTIYDGTTVDMRIGALYSSGYNTSDLVTIKGNGNVGIGTTSPSEKLHVDGNVIVTYNNSFQGINSIGNKAILARVSPTTGIINYAEYATATNLNGFVLGSDDARVKGNIATDSLEFITNGSTQAFINSSGNVGIGTTSPSTKLHITGGFLRLDALANNANGWSVSTGTGYLSSRITTDNHSRGWGWEFTDNYVDYATPTAYFRVGYNGAVSYLNSGNFGISTTSPSYKLDVVGDSRITSGSLGVGVAPNATDGRIDASNDIVAYSTSDQRLKENVTPIESALEKVKTLTGVEFDWKEETAHVHGYHGHDVGIIAQDVQAVLPEAVRTNESGYLSVRYEKMIALLIEANKELAARVELLEQKLKQ